MMENQTSCMDCFLAKFVVWSQIQFYKNVMEIQ
jgi:hypothetical protein